MCSTLYRNFPYGFCFTFSAWNLFYILQIITLALNYVKCNKVKEIPFLPKWNTIIIYYQMLAIFHRLIFVSPFRKRPGWYSCVRMGSCYAFYALLWTTWISSFLNFLTICHAHIYPIFLNGWRSYRPTWLSVTHTVFPCILSYEIVVPIITIFAIGITIKALPEGFYEIPNFTMSILPRAIYHNFSCYNNNNNLYD